MKIMTNSSFQKPIIKQKVGAKRKEPKKSTVASVEVKWQTGCAIPRVGCPLGINDVMTLPHQVETDQWNCFSGNVKNLLAVLGQSNDRIEDNLSALISHGDLGCMKGNLVWGVSGCWIPYLHFAM